MPRYMLLRPATEDSEAGSLPPMDRRLDSMRAYNASLAEAGVLVASEDLAETAKGVRIIFPPAVGQSRDPTFRRHDIQPGPFAVEQERLLAGFWIIYARDIYEAADWARKAPLVGTELEVRLVQEVDVSRMRSWRG
ncbi:MAG: hypothetical protein M1825_004330 [Sarcosagium campestre]|nr:MAG: hypothetical protein M1825_004330 [Sarcosagium campestre]